MSSFENPTPPNEFPNDDVKKENPFPFKVELPNGVIESFQTFKEMQEFIETYKEEEK